MAHTYSNPVYNINADIISIAGHTVEGNEVDIKTDSGQDIRFNQDVITTGSMRSELYARQEGELWAIITSSAIEFQKPVDFQNVAITNLAGINLNCTQVSSSNYSGQSLDHELDQLTSAQNTILARTQGLTANKLMVSNGAGILASSSLAETDLFRFNQASNQYQGSGTNTVYSQTQSSDSNSALNYLQMRQGSGGNATEMGLRMYGNEQAFLFQDTIQLKDVGAGSYPGTNIGQIKNSGINLITGKTYQINGSDLNFTHLAGSASTGQIPSLPASQITSGAFATARIPSLPTSQITSGTFATARIPSLSTSQITSGTFSTDRLPTLPTSQITSGTFIDARIPSLATSKITSGTFVDARIPSLATSKITSGTFATARIPSLPASQITSGVIADARLPTTLLKSTTAETIINTGNTNGTNFHIRHSSNFQGAPSLSVEDYNATGSQLQAGILTLDSDDVAIKNTDSDGGIVFYNNTNTFLGRLDNDGMNIKSGLTYKVNGTAIPLLTTGTQTIQGVKTFPDQPIFVNGITASTSSTLGASTGNHTHIIHGVVDLRATMTQTAGHEANFRTTVVTGNLTQTGGNTSLTGNLTHTGGTVDITGDVLLDGHMTVDTGHDIKILNDSVGIFSRVSTLEGNRHLLHILGSTSVNTSLVMSCKFWSLPMNSGYALNDYVMGQGHTTTPQTKKYSNHYQTVFDGTIGTDMTDFTKTISSVSASAYSLNINIGSSDWSGGSTIQNVIISGTGYINWAHSSYPSNVRSKYNKMIRVGHYCDDAVKVTIDGQAIVWAKYGFSNSISGTGNDSFNSVFVVRGDISAIEILYIGGGGGNYCNLQFNILGAWD